MTYQTLNTYQDGQPVPASQWNALRDNQEWLTAHPMCILETTGRQAISGDGYGTFTTAPVDTDTFHRDDTPDRATVPMAGVYLITGWCELPPIGAFEAVGGGPVSPGSSAAIPYLITSGGTATMSVNSRGIDSPYAFSLLYPLTVGDSVLLKFDVTPILRFGLSLEWMRP